MCYVNRQLLDNVKKRENGFKRDWMLFKKLNLLVSQPENHNLTRKT